MRTAATALPIPRVDVCADADHPWYLDLRPDPVGAGRSEAERADDAHAALSALDAVGATVIAVHADSVPSLGDLVAGRPYIGWTICVPGAVERSTIEAIAATAGGGYRATLTPGHPLPPLADTGQR